MVALLRVEQVPSWCADERGGHAQSRQHIRRLGRDLHQHQHHAHLHYARHNDRAECNLRHLPRADADGERRMRRGGHAHWHCDDQRLSHRSSGPELQHHDTSHSWNGLRVLQVEWLFEQHRRAADVFRAERRRVVGGEFRAVLSADAAHCRGHRHCDGQSDQESGLCGGRLLYRWSGCVGVNVVEPRGGHIPPVERRRQRHGHPRQLHDAGAVRQHHRQVCRMLAYYDQSGILEWSQRHNHRHNYDDAHLRPRLLPCRCADDCQRDRRCWRHVHGVVRWPDQHEQPL